MPSVTSRERSKLVSISQRTSSMATKIRLSLHNPSTIKRKKSSSSFNARVKPIETRNRLVSSLPMSRFSRLSVFIFRWGLNDDLHSKRSGRESNRSLIPFNWPVRFVLKGTMKVSSGRWEKACQVSLGSRLSVFSCTTPISTSSTSSQILTHPKMKRKIKKTAQMTPTVMKKMDKEIMNRLALT